MIHLILALIICCFVGGLAGYIGSLMLSKRMSLVGGPLGHLALPGITLALLYGFDVSLGALLFLTIGIALIWFFELRTKLPLEALTAIVFASSVAVTFLFLPEEESFPALIGDISQINLPVVIITALSCVAVFFIVKKIFSKTVLITISEDLAVSEKISVKKYNLIYLACIAVTIALGVRIVGGLMTAAIVAIPAATSRNISTNLKSYAYLSMGFGVASCLAGVIASSIISFSPGPLIIIANTIFFLVSLTFKKAV